MVKTKPSLIRTIFGMMINPSGTLKDALSETKWLFSVTISSAAFGLFFVQTGLDLYKTGQREAGFVILSGITGMLYGMLVIPMLAALIWVILKAAKSSESIMQVISSFCLSYCGALVYGALGLVFSLVLGWKTSVAFGVTGVLWAIGPMMVTIRELAHGKNALSITIATLVSAIVLLSWSFLGNI